MAIEIAFAKRAKITEAQKYMLLAVFGAAIVLGATIAIVVHSIDQISYNAKAIAAEDQAIVSYSDAIKTIGICPKPSNNASVYSDDDLKKCTPNNVTAYQVSGSLRSNILTNLAANEALTSVPNESDSACINQTTNKNYTYDELQKRYDDATTEEELVNASDLIQTCSALRVIPDALPASRNEEALLASLNKIFLDSNWTPQSLSPTGEVVAAGFGTNLNAMSLRLSVEADAAVTKTVLSNIERSIREFNINRATIEWSSDNSLTLQAQATAYYMDESSLDESQFTVRKGGK